MSYIYSWIPQAINLLLTRKCCLCFQLFITVLILNMLLIQVNISLIFPSNSEAFALELVGNFEETFPTLIIMLSAGWNLQPQLLCDLTWKSCNQETFLKEMFPVYYIQCDVYGSNLQSFQMVHLFFPGNTIECSWWGSQDVRKIINTINEKTFLRILKRIRFKLSMKSLRNETCEQVLWTVSHLFK